MGKDPVVRKPAEMVRHLIQTSRHIEEGVEGGPEVVWNGEQGGSDVDDYSSEDILPLVLTPDVSAEA